MLGVIGALLLTVQAGAQAQRTPITAAEVAKMEAALKQVPRDPTIRSALLAYYLRSRPDPAVAIPARRRHILWVIENAPDSELAYGPLVCLDPAGHPLADPEGFRLASEAWRKQAASKDAKALTLANAAYFFKMEDKPYALSLLQRALSLEPKNEEVAARLGDEYALLILGVTMINGSSYPVRSDAALLESELAKTARDELEASSNPYVVAKAGYQLLWQGDVLYYSGRLPFDPQPLAKATLERAVSLAPDDKDVAALRAEYEKFQLEKEGRAPLTVPAPVLAAVPPLAAPDPPPADPPPATPPPPPPAAPPPAPALTADALKKVAAGTPREELLKLGRPANRISMNDEGHLIEIYQYSANGVRLGTVRLQDGAVASVKVP